MARIGYVAFVVVMLVGWGLLRASGCAPIGAAEAARPVASGPPSFRGPSVLVGPRRGFGGWGGGK
ncbi:MAG: hypothetical protein NZ898_03155 [Myxococcota bacterium]|nr:hypothetical protein [Myxococcota bacterium]MDW8363885.1 hypothetical protein [Myxococcales bacterium]